MRPLASPLAWLAAVFLGVGIVPTARASPPPRQVNVVLVHGIWKTGKIFGPMMHVLEQEGYACCAPDLTPNDCRLGVRDLSRKLAAAIDARFGPSAPVVLIGFSMGGLVSRDYVENVVADRRRVRGVFLIASAGQGTLWANLSPTAGQRDMAIGSPFLGALNADRDPWKDIPLHAYWTPLDLMIVPAVNSRWPQGQATRVLCPAHPLMVRNRVVIADIAARLTAISPAVRRDTAPPAAARQRSSTTSWINEVNGRR